MSSVEQRIRLAVDVGGTFTDLVLLKDDGTVVAHKVLSTPSDFSAASKQGILEVLEESKVRGSMVKEFIHGATVATNAIITRTGAVTGLLTTNGFRDVLELRRMRMPRLYDMNWEKPLPLVPRHLRLEVPGRMNPWGEEQTPLDEAALYQAVQRLAKEGVESIAVCYLHAYANDAHEKATKRVIQEMASSAYVSLSSEVLPEIKEYERTSTTVINAYVQPVVSTYLGGMERDLKGMGIDVPVMLMQSNGGMMPSELARQFPMHIIESGPAAGVVGAYHLATRLGIKDALTLDMGGTTAKACLIEDGVISRSPEYEVGGEVSIGHSLTRGGGYPLRVPSVDLAEVGAGGGSIAWADELGVLKVGPRSAGAFPGPASYGLGGEEPTLTDANVYLGFASPEHLAGGSVKISPHLAEQAIRDRVAGPLALDTLQAAWGIRQVSTSSLIRAIRAVSTERGRDPRQFLLFAFGGMGPGHALDLADELGIGTVIVPPLPGLFSALGLLFAEVEHHLIRTHLVDTAKVDHVLLNDALGDLGGQAMSTLERQGYAAEHRSIDLLADMRYRGQDYALTVPFRSRRVGPEVLANLIEEFHREHEKTYGYRSDSEETQIVALRCVARGLSTTPRLPERLHLPAAQGRRQQGTRRCYFGPEHGWTETPVLGRADLSGGPVRGPAIIEEDDSSTVLKPGWTATLGEWSHMVLERQ